MYKVGIYSIRFKEKYNHNICSKMDGFRMYNTKQGHTISENKPHVLPHMQDIVNNINIYVNKYTCGYKMQTRGKAKYEGPRKN